MHCELTDEKLIAALGELNSLYSLNLEGCCKLSDRTLEFLAQRFASTLKILYLDHRCLDRGGYGFGVEPPSIYTSTVFASLHAQCTHLRIYHYR